MMDCHLEPDYDDYDIGYVCEKCEEHKESIQDAADHLMGIIQVLSGSDEIDLIDLYGRFEEIAFSLGCDVPDVSLTIKRI